MHLGSSSGLLDHMPLVFLWPGKVLQSIFRESCDLADAQFDAVLPAGDSNSGVWLKGIKGVVIKFVIVRYDRRGVVARA